MLRAHGSGTCRLIGTDSFRREIKMMKKSWAAYWKKQAKVKAELAKAIADLCEEYDCDEEDLPEEEYWETRNEVYRDNGFSGDPCAPTNWMPTRYDPACRP